MCSGGKCLHPVDVVCLIFAYIQAIMSALGVLVGLTYVVTLKAQVMELFNLKDKPYDTIEEDDKLGAFVIIVIFSALTVIIIGIMIGNFLISCVLIHGVQKRKEQHVFAYFIVAVIVTAMYISGVIMAQSLLGTFAFQPYIPFLFKAGISIIVYDSYRRIKLDRTQGYLHKKFTNEMALCM